MAIKVEDEFDRAERLAKKLERYEHAADLENELGHSPPSPAPVTNPGTPTDVGPGTSTLIPILKFAGVVCVAMAIALGATIDWHDIRPPKDPSISISAPLIPRSERVLVEVPGPGEIEFSGRIPTTSDVQIQSARVLNIERNTWTELKNVRCDTARKTAFRCNAEFEGPTAPESHVLRVIVGLDDHTTVLNSQTFAPTGFGKVEELKTDIEIPADATPVTTRVERSRSSPIHVRSWDFTEVQMQTGKRNKLPIVEYQWTMRLQRAADTSIEMNTRMRIVNLDSGFSEELANTTCSVAASANFQISTCRAEVNTYLKTGDYQVRGDLINSASGDTSAVSVSFKYSVK